MSGYRFDRLRVLVVDDNPHMRRLVITILQGFGAKQICEAHNAERAWAIVGEVNPDVVFLDWMMDGMSGIDFASMLRTSAASPNPYVPIIMLTGNTSTDSVQKARDAGVNEYLAKPVSARGILTRLTSVIENPRAFVRTKAYFGPCRRRRVNGEYRGPERRSETNALALDDVRAAS